VPQAVASGRVVALPPSCSWDSGNQDTPEELNTRLGVRGVLAHAVAMGVWKASGGSRQ
jgi:hypothetical protein